MVEVILASRAIKIVEQAWLDYNKDFEKHVDWHLSQFNKKIEALGMHSDSTSISLFQCDTERERQAVLTKIKAAGYFLTRIYGDTYKVYFERPWDPFNWIRDLFKK